MEIKENGIVKVDKKGAWSYSGNKIKYCCDTPFKTMPIFVKFAVELLAL